MELLVGRVGRAHGVRGEVLIAVRTDEPEDRFAVGSVLETDPATDPAGVGPLTVADSRWHSGKLVVRFDGVDDRVGAQNLRGVALVVDSDDLPPPEDPDEFRDHELVGLQAQTVGGVDCGEVADIVHGPGGDLLVLARDGAEILIPFVRAMVPTIDLSARRVVVDPPPGLLDL